MADDGMLLNFDIGDGVLATKPIFKGGRWKDRLAAKRTISRVRKPKDATTTEGNVPASSIRESENSDPDTGARNIKRLRLNGEYRPAAQSAPPPQHTARASGPASGAPKQIVSSLFTYNPLATTKAAPTATAEAPVEPSNAPLSSELETFTSLGLTTGLASHLLNKMKIKAPTAIQKAAIQQLLREDSDAFLQAETGSGKTLAYLLPIVQRIVKIAEAGKEGKDKDAVYRKSGLFAIVLAPTRELSKQIQVVLESLLRCAHWIVSGIVIGGEKKQSEKARLRKGVNILVATPGRLADHLQNTEALDVSNVRWLVLDEGDRLMELGFKNDIQKIVGILNLRLKATGQKVPGLPSKRTTVLCSATLKVDVQRLGEISLKDAVHIQKEPGEKDDTVNGADGNKEEEFSAPAQLKQSYVVVPAKLRLVTLIAFLKRAFERRGSVMKAIVFISCADSVDFHFDLLTKLSDSDSASTADNTSKPSSDTKPSLTTHAPSPLLTSAPKSPLTLHRLHGSLPQSLRTSTITHFTRLASPAILLATDVASRGLDLPSVDLVLEYDPAFARPDHLHRIGRTARAGRDGRAAVFLMPGCEERYVDLLQKDRWEGEGSVVRSTAEEVLQRALGGNKPAASTKAGGKARGMPAAGESWSERATALQLRVERWLLAGGAAAGTVAERARLGAAKKAFQAHVRAYATHVAAERECFDIKELHLGHLAKAFGLRDRPGGLGGGMERRVGKERRGVGEKKDKGEERDDEDGDDVARRMRRVVGKLKASSGADEFNIG